MFPRRDYAQEFEALVKRQKEFAEKEKREVDIAALTVKQKELLFTLYPFGKDGMEPRLFRKEDELEEIDTALHELDYLGLVSSWANTCLPGGGRIYPGTQMVSITHKGLFIVAKLLATAVQTIQEEK